MARSLVRLTAQRRCFQAGAWRRIARFGVAVWGAVWVWAIVDSYDGSAASLWKPAAIGIAVAIAADQRAKRMGLEFRGNRVIFHYALRRRVFKPGEILRFDLEGRKGPITAAQTRVLVARTVSDGTLRVPTLAFVAPGWRERVFGGARLVWGGGASQEIESVVNECLASAAQADPAW